MHFACADVRGSKSDSIVEGLLLKGTSLVQTFVAVRELDSYGVSSVSALRSCQILLRRYE